MIPSPDDRRTVERPPGSEAWSQSRREEWRIHFFEEQIALEAERRRNEAALQRAVFFGSLGGLVIGCMSLFF